MQAAARRLTIVLVRRRPLIIAVLLLLHALPLLCCCCRRYRCSRLGAHLGVPKLGEDGRHRRHARRCRRHLQVVDAGQLPLRLVPGTATMPGMRAVGRGRPLWRKSLLGRRGARSIGRRQVQIRHDHTLAATVGLPGHGGRVAVQRGAS